MVIESSIGVVIMLRIFKMMNIRNRAYVIDSKGNKLFYGTEFQCKKFMEYLEKEGVLNVSNGDGMAATRQALCKSLVPSEDR